MKFFSTLFVTSISSFLKFLSKLGQRVPVLTVLFLPLSHPLDTLAQKPAQVLWQAQHLSVTAQAAPLLPLLQKLARQTGLHIQGGETLREEQISVHFSALSLNEGMQRLLTNINYLFIEKPALQEHPQSSQLIIFGRRGPSSAMPTTEMQRMGSMPDQADPARIRLNTLIEVIQKGGNEAGVALQAATLDPDTQVQTLAFQTLLERNPDTAQMALLTAAKTGSPATRMTALQISGANEKIGFPVLMEALTDTDREVKGYALQLLADKESPEAVQALGRTLHDPDPVFRQFAIQVLGQQALGRRNDQTIRAYLTEALHDPNEAVRNLAEEVLRHPSGH
jgi:HEAT repeat protein